jgi:hypothetical protein
VQTALRFFAAVILRPWAVLLVACAMAHGILPFTDYIIWDGWILDGVFSHKEGREHFRHMVADGGRPLDKVFLTPIATFESRFLLSKVASLTCWCLSAVLMMHVLSRLGGLPATVAAAIAMVAGTAPVFEQLGELSMWIYTACVGLFWLGWATVCVMRLSGGWAAIGWRCAALGLFTLSFDLNSQLVMFYAVALVLFFLRYGNHSIRSMVQKVGHRCLRYADFLALPLVYWFWESVLTPSRGHYVSYNKPSFHIMQFAAGYSRLVTDFLVPSIGELFGSSSSMATAVFVTAFVTWLVSRAIPEGASSWLAQAEEASRSCLSATLAACGAFLLAASAFPYIAVSQNLESWGWWSRNCVLCPLPIGMLVVGGAAGITKKLIGRPSSLWLVPVVMITTLAICDCNHRYLRLQAFGAKQMAICSALQSKCDASHPTVVQMRDYFRIPRVIAAYPPAIWTYIAAYKRPRITTFVFETSQAIPDQSVTDDRGESTTAIPVVTLTTTQLEQMIESTTMSYAMQAIPREGTQIMLVARPGAHGDDGSRIGLRYLWLKYFAPKEFGRFKDQLVFFEDGQLPPVVSK